MNSVAISNQIEQTEYPYDELESLWKIVLFNQFHDILAGTSIKGYMKRQKLITRKLLYSQGIQHEAFQPNKQEQ